MESFRRVGATAAVVIASLIGASTAAAQSAGGDGGGDNRVRTKHVTKFIKQKMVIAHRAVPTVFPNAEFERFDRRDILDGGDLYLNCFPSDFGTRRRPIWACGYSIYLTERNRSNPDQWTLRSCETPDRAAGDYSIKRSPLLYVEQAKKNSRKLRIKGAWRMTCPIDEQTIGWWNESGPDYYPDVSSSEATPYEHVQSDQSFIDTDRDDLLPAPSGTPGPPPGPLAGSGPPALDKSAPGKSARGWVGPSCNWPGHWMQFSTGTYAVYSCFWTDAGLGGIPGAAINLFATQTWYQSYYWTGNRTGNDIWRLFQEGLGNGPRYARPVVTG